MEGARQVPTMDAIVLVVNAVWWLLLLVGCWMLVLVVLCDTVILWDVREGLAAPTHTEKV